MKNCPPGIAGNSTRENIYIYIINRWKGSLTNAVMQGVTKGKIKSSSKAKSFKTTLI